MRAHVCTRPMLSTPSRTHNHQHATTTTQPTIYRHQKANQPRPEIIMTSRRHCLSLFPPRTRPFIRSLRTIDHPIALRPKPLYDADVIMPHGLPTILSPSAYASLRHVDPQHPRIRRHDAALSAIERYMLDADPCPYPRPKYSSVPPLVKHLCKHYNKHFLIRKTDRKLCPKCLWRIIHRRLYANTAPPTSHRAIYFQQRHPDKDEVKKKFLKRRKPKCQNQIGEEDYTTIKSNTTVYHPTNESLLYIAENLHNTAHGSVCTDKIENRGILFDFLDVPNDVVSPSTVGPDSVQRTNNLVVAFTGNTFIQELDQRLVGGLATFHHNLTTHMLQTSGRDPSRFVGMGEDNLNHRFTWGYGRCQNPELDRKWQVHLWKLFGENMPTINYLQFKELPSSLKNDLVAVLEMGQAFADHHFPNSYNNKMRTKHCSKLMNELMGFPKAAFRFEYIDIVLSRNTELPKHIDSKNDHRDGYHLTVVYSFYCVIGGKEYKVSVIMCSRNDLGVAFERAMENKKRNKSVSGNKRDSSLNGNNKSGKAVSNKKRRKK